MAQTRNNRITPITLDPEARAIYERMRRKFPKWRLSTWVNEMLKSEGPRWLK